MNTTPAPSPAPVTAATSGDRHRSALHVYDPAMCCSTGVCGPQVDPTLVRVASDLQWLQAQGVEVRRFNLAQNPAAFVENDLVRTALTEKGESALPFLLVDGRTVASGHYPTREQLAGLCHVSAGEGLLARPACTPEDGCCS